MTDKQQITKEKKSGTTSHALDIAYIALGTALITVCSWLTVPFVPLTVPFTMQTFAVFTVAGLLGWKRGTASILVYIMLGLFGVPVFSGFRGGFGVLAGATGGYIIGFVFTVLCVGLCTKFFGTRALPLTVSMVAGLALCYTFGTAWFMLVYSGSAGEVGVSTALGLCVVPYLIPDGAKIALSVLIVNRVGKVIKK